MFCTQKSKSSIRLLVYKIPATPLNIDKDHRCISFLLLKISNMMFNNSGIEAEVLACIGALKTRSNKKGLLANVQSSILLLPH